MGCISLWPQGSVCQIAILYKKKRWVLELLEEELSPNLFKQLERRHGKNNLSLVGALPSKEILLRTFFSPARKKSDLIAAIPGYVEKLLFLPTKELVVCPSIAMKKHPSPGFQVTLCATMEEKLQEKLLDLHPYAPDKLFSSPTALYRFVRLYDPKSDNLCVSYKGTDSFVIAIQNGELVDSKPFEDIQEGFAYMKRHYKEISKLLQTGETDSIESSFREGILNLKQSLWQTPYSPQKLLQYAIPIGLALEATTSSPFALYTKQQTPQYTKKVARYWMASAAFSLLLCASTQFKGEIETKGLYRDSIVEEKTDLPKKSPYPKGYREDRFLALELLTWLSQETTSCKQTSNLISFRYELLPQPNRGKERHIKLRCSFTTDTKKSDTLIKMLERCPYLDQPKVSYDLQKNLLHLTCIGSVKKIIANPTTKQKKDHVPL